MKTPRPGPITDVMKPANEETGARANSARAFLQQHNLALPDLPAHLIFWPLTLAGLALDLWTKRAVFDWLEYKPDNRITIVDGFLQLRMALNDGAAFGIAAGRLSLLVAVSVLALVAILAIFIFGAGRQRLVHVALALFAAGVSGNLCDRIFNAGLVRDFIDVVYWPGRHWPAFNAADALLCIGVGLLIFGAVFTDRSSRERAQQHK